MTGPITPWSAEAELGRDGASVELTVFLSLDPGPMREFRPFLTVNLDEAHATVLLGQLGFALQDIRRAREASNILPLRPDCAR